MTSILGCTSPIENSTQLSGPITCALDNKCTRVDCCVDVGFLGKSFHGFIHLDPCNFRLSVGVEKLKFDLELFQYPWGKCQK